MKVIKPKWSPQTAHPHSLSMLGKQARSSFVREKGFIRDQPKNKKREREGNDDNGEKADL